MSQESACRDPLDNFRKLNNLQWGYLKYVGLTAVDSDASTFLKRLYYIYNKLVLMAVLIFTITLLADICLSFDDLNIVTDDGCILAGLVIALFKIMTLRVRHGQIVRLIREITESCSELAKSSVGGEDEIIKKYQQKFRVIFHGFSILGFLLGVALIFFVPVENGELPLRAWYPFDTTRSPWHQIGFFIEVCAIFVCITGLVGMDGLYVYLCNLLLVQFEILNIHFKRSSNQRNALSKDLDHRDDLNITTVTLNKISSIIKNNCRKYSCDRDNIHCGFMKQFTRSIRNHQRLLAMIHDVNDVFSNCMFIQMLSSTTMICLTGFQATLVMGHRSNTYKFSIYLMTAISQLFYICWMGNEVMYQNASLTQSQWLSKWYDELSVNTGHIIILSMIFSKKTLYLKAGAFYVLSTKTFLAILKGSYSFFVMLNTMHSNLHSKNELNR